MVPRRPLHCNDSNHGHKIIDQYLSTKQNTQSCTMVTFVDEKAAKAYECGICFDIIKKAVMVCEDQLNNVLCIYHLNGIIKLFTHQYVVHFVMIVLLH